MSIKVVLLLVSFGCFQVSDTPENLSGPEREVIDLVGGNSVTGTVIKEDDQKIFVDIGPTIIQLPTDAIIRRQVLDISGEAVPEGQGETTREPLTCIPRPSRFSESPGTSVQWEPTWETSETPISP